MENGIVIFYCGVALVALSLFFVVRKLRRRSRCSSYAVGILTEAAVVNGSFVRLTVQFTAEGRAMTLTEKRGAPLRLKKMVGKDVDVRYNPDNPEDFYVEQNPMERRAALICLCFGLAFLFGGAFIAGPRAYELPFGRQFLRLFWWLRYRVFS